MFGAHLLEAVSVTQGTIALSSAEAELYALGRASAGALLVTHALQEMELAPEPPLVLTDSNACRGAVTRVGAG
eukprot:2337039-Alexandrium_andersonii.AAC.1